MADPRQPTDSEKTLFAVVADPEAVDMDLEWPADFNHMMKTYYPSVSFRAAPLCDSSDTNQRVSDDRTEVARTNGSETCAWWNNLPVKPMCVLVVGGDRQTQVAALDVLIPGLEARLAEPYAACAALLPTAVDRTIDGAVCERIPPSYIVRTTEHAARTFNGLQESQQNCQRCLVPSVHIVDASGAEMAETTRRLATNGRHMHTDAVILCSTRRITRVEAAQADVIVFCDPIDDRDMGLLHRTLSTPPRVADTIDGVLTLLGRGQCAIAWEARERREWRVAPLDLFPSRRDDDDENHAAVAPTGWCQNTLHAWAMHWAFARTGGPRLRRLQVRHGALPKGVRTLTEVAARACVPLVCTIETTLLPADCIDILLWAIAASIDLRDNSALVTDLLGMARRLEADLTGDDKALGCSASGLVTAILARHDGRACSDDAPDVAE